MTKEKLDQLLQASAITHADYQEMLGDVLAREKEQVEIDKTTVWYEKFEKANHVTKKRMGADLTSNLFMRSALTSDPVESKQHERNAYNIRSATKKIGGLINI